jgi:hypothetical protein
MFYILNAGQKFCNKYYKHLKTTEINGDGLSPLSEILKTRENYV